MRLISQLINSISIVLQKLLKYCNGTTISTFFVLPSAGAFPVILIFDMNYSDCVILSLNHHYNTSINFLMFLNHYRCII